MVKKKSITKKKKNVRKTKIKGGRHPSKNDKSSKVKKLIKLAKSKKGKKKKKR